MQPKNTLFIGSITDFLKMVSVLEEFRVSGVSVQVSVFPCLTPETRKLKLKDERPTSNVQRRMKNKQPMARIFSHLTFDVGLLGFAPSAGTETEVSIQSIQTFQRTGLTGQRANGLTEHKMEIPIR